MNLPLNSTELGQALPRSVAELPGPDRIAGQGWGRKLQCLGDGGRSPGLCCAVLGREMHRMGQMACVTLLGSPTSTSVEVGDRTVNLKPIFLIGMQSVAQKIGWDYVAQQ